MATFMPKIPPQSPLVSSQYTLPRRLVTTVAPDNYVDAPRGYAAVDAADDHLFYHGYDDDNDDDYYDDDGSEWTNSYNFGDTTGAN